MKNKVLVIGDTILDEYIYVNPKKVSDEAHVITSNIIDKKYALGGASNVARNVSTLGGSCTYLGLSSKLVARQLQTCMQEYDLTPILFETENSVQIKTRIVSTRGAQVSRFDSMFEQICDSSIQEKILQYLNQHLWEFNFIIISKYYDFFLTPQFITEIIKLAKKNNIAILADNRQANIECFKDIDFYKINFNEFCAIYNCPGIANTKEMIEQLILKHGMLVDCLLITRSALPTIICQKRNNQICFKEIPVEEVRVSDVSGAGDTFVATFSTNYESGKNTLDDIIDIIRICHQVCNIVVRKMGTSVVWSYEINSNVSLQVLCEQLKKNGKRIVFTNGVFDILHIGHIKILKESKNLGDYLIVGLNSDESVRKLKGPTRPINEERDRKIILESMRFVDHVVIFGENTVARLLEEIKPDVYVKGGDYTVDTLPEKESLKYVGKVHFVKTVKGKSSTETINKIKR